MLELHLSGSEFLLADIEFLMAGSNLPMAVSGFSLALTYLGLALTKFLLADSELPLALTYRALALTELPLATIELALAGSDLPMATLKLIEYQLFMPEAASGIFRENSKFLTTKTKKVPSTRVFVPAHFASTFGRFYLKAAICICAKSACKISSAPHKT